MEKLELPCVIPCPPISLEEAKEYLISRYPSFAHYGGSLSVKKFFARGRGIKVIGLDKSRILAELARYSEGLYVRASLHTK